MRTRAGSPDSSAHKAPTTTHSWRAGAGGRAEEEEGRGAGARGGTARRARRGARRPLAAAPLGRLGARAGRRGPGGGRAHPGAAGRGARAGGHLTCAASAPACLSVARASVSSGAAAVVRGAAGRANGQRVSALRREQMLPAHVHRDACQHRREQSVTSPIAVRAGVSSRGSRRNPVKDRCSNTGDSVHGCFARERKGSECRWPRWRAWRARCSWRSWSCGARGGARWSPARCPATRRTCWATAFLRTACIGKAAALRLPALPHPVKNLLGYCFSAYCLRRCGRGLAPAYPTLPYKEPAGLSASPRTACAGAAAAPRLPGRCTFAGGLHSTRSTSCALFMDCMRCATCVSCIGH